MNWSIRKYDQYLRGHFRIPWHFIFLALGCTSNYELVTSPVSYQSGITYSSFMVITTKAYEPHYTAIYSLVAELERSLKDLGLKEDSLGPDLLFIVRWETHLIGKHSSGSNRPKINSPGGSVRYFGDDSFYRIQAIDALNNELVWSVKIYPRKRDGLSAKSIPLVIRDLTRSFAQVQSNNSKIQK